MVTPLVTVIIPTYNRAHCIERALNSVLQQTFIDYEVLICDDTSTDNTYNIVMNYQTLDKRIKWLSTNINAGSADARNRGMAIAQGKYIAFLDSDDEWHAEKLFYQVKAMESAPEKTAICLSGAVIYKNGDLLNPKLHTPLKKWEINSFKRYVLGEITFLTPTILFRRSCLNTIGQMEVAMRRNQDMEFLLRILSQFDLLILENNLTNVYLELYNRKHYPALLTALPYHLRHYDMIRKREGWWVAIRYRTRFYQTMLFYSILEKKWGDVPHWLNKRITSFFLPSPKDFTNFARLIVHWTKILSK